MIKQKIISLLQQAGACSIGFADIVEASPAWLEEFNGMVDEGRHGTMAFMERNRQLRRDPSLLLDGAKTLISLAFSYDKGVRNPRIASYALVQDYHYYLRQLLEPVVRFLEEELGAQSRICVDSAPVAERYWALRTGVGVKGRNQQLMVPGIGARVFLAEILTTAHIEPDPAIDYQGYADVCIGCDQCVRACPNGALSDPDKFDSRRCVSYLTIEHRGDLPSGLNLAGKIYGCDICLDACPYNNYNILDNTNLKLYRNIDDSDHNATPITGSDNINSINIGLDIESDIETESSTDKDSKGKATIEANAEGKDEADELEETHEVDEEIKGGDNKIGLDNNSSVEPTVTTDPEHSVDCIPKLEATFISDISENTFQSEVPSPNTGDNGVEKRGFSAMSDRGSGFNKNKPNRNFYTLHLSANSPFEIDTNILSLTTQDIENMTSGQYRKLTKKSAMSRCPLSQLRRNL